MKQKLTFRQYIYVGSMLFGILFGAGNLIFPVSLGQNSGAHFNIATIGFLISAIGLPLLTFVALGMSQTLEVFTLAKRVSPKFATIFTLLLYLVIGPLFALPRLATTSFTIGAVPFIQGLNQQTGLHHYVMTFFVVAFLLALNPTKLMQYVGKILTPLFLLTLGVLLIMTIIHPMGNPQTIVAQANYATHPLIQGVLDGYQTLDVLGALAYGILVIQTLNQLGVTEPKAVAVDMIKSSIISVIIMGVIYWFLAYAGASSLGQLALSENGGVALSQITHYYLGTNGSILLAIIVILGCLKTAVGLLTAFSETMLKLFPAIPYKVSLVLVTIASALVATTGLNNLISWAVPVLMFLYPIAIALILLAIIEPHFAKSSTVYRWTIGFTTLAALLDGIANIPASATAFDGAKQIVSQLNVYIPFANIGMGWIIPSLIGFGIGYVLYRAKQN